MEGDMHKAAMAHYAHLSMDEKQKVLRSFEQTDANGDGQVTLDECSTFFAIPSYKQSGRIRVALIDLFKHLDKNNDGTLDFEEFITCYYVFSNSNYRACATCGSVAWGVYFVCVECYNVDKENSYDLCCSCYHKKNFSHVHSYFLDTNALLRKIQCEDTLAQDKMEEMREVAMAYYAKKPDDQKQLVRNFLKRLDANGDGKVAIQEYLDYAKEMGLSRHLTPNLFKLLDKYDEGTLDFEECITLFYMDKGHRLLLCDGCGSHILGIHFICVECFNISRRTYDLCCSCYRNNNFNHVHSSASFLDNYALLRSKRKEDIKEKMKEMREVAMAYYAKLPYDQKQLVWSFFQRLDANGDGKVSIQEYMDFAKESGSSKFLTPKLFKLLDKDDDCTLDFEECVTFFYMDISSRLAPCDGCGSYMLGLHFICVECYNVGERTYDLCCSCYHNNNFNHVHSFFLDNNALLGYLRNKKREKELEDVSRGIETGCRIAPVTQPAAVAHPAAAVKSHSRRKQLGEGLETTVRHTKNVLDAVRTAQDVATNCNTM